jgi:hypothetical protein
VITGAQTRPSAFLTNQFNISEEGGGKNKASIGELYNHCSVTRVAVAEKLLSGFRYNAVHSRTDGRVRELLEHGAVSWFSILLTELSVSSYISNGMTVLLIASNTDLT